MEWPNPKHSKRYTNQILMEKSGYKKYNKLRLEFGNTEWKKRFVDVSCAKFVHRYVPVFPEINNSFCIPNVERNISLKVKFIQRQILLGVYLKFKLTTILCKIHDQRILELLLKYWNMNEKRNRSQSTNKHG